MKGNRKKNRARLFDSKVQVGLILCLLVLLVLFGGAVVVSVFFDVSETAQKWLALLTGSVDALSVFLVPVLSVWVTRNVIRSKNRLEEEFKIEPDHHKIVCQYKKHSRQFLNYANMTDNKVDKDGILMSLTNVAGGKTYNPVEDEHSESYFERQRDVNFYKNGRLLLPSVNVFTNNTCKLNVVFDDSKSYYELPPLLKENAAKLISAHKASSIGNSVTIRLKDFEYENSTLKLVTERSKYMDMLMTNRCMDFDLDGMSVRSLYEPESAVSPLKDSKLCNQIGINGLVYTSDNYLLIEKRGRKKAVWKNKFAQPISLALKLKDVVTNSNGLIGSSPEDAEACFKGVISKTLSGNFGLTAKDNGIDGDYDFELSKNFMGIARDLLEGGKPNLYFYVKVDMTAKQLKQRLEDNSKLAVSISHARNSLAVSVSQRNDQERKTLLSEIDFDSKKPLYELIRNGKLAAKSNGGKTVIEFVGASKTDSTNNADTMIAELEKTDQETVDKCLGDILTKKLPNISSGKLDSQFYLVKRDDIKLDYNYATKLYANKTYAVQRAFNPCVSKLKAWLEKNRVAKFNANQNGKNRKHIDRECGEALLASLYYAAILDVEKRK